MRVVIIMALPFFSVCAAFIAHANLTSEAQRDIPTENLAGGDSKSPKTLKRSESEYSLGLSRNRSVNADLNEVGNVCTNKEALNLSLKIATGVLLAGVLFGKYIFKK